MFSLRRRASSWLATVFGPWSQPRESRSRRLHYPGWNTRLGRWPWASTRLDFFALHVLRGVWGWSNWGLGWTGRRGIDRADPTIGFDLDIRLAIGASIVSVIATSSGAGAALVRDRLTNIRVASFLQVATVLGAIGGAILAPHIGTRWLYLLFGGILLFSALPMVRKVSQDVPANLTNDAWADKLRLASSYPERQLGKEVHYAVTGVPLGFILMCSPVRFPGCLASAPGR